MNTSTSSTVVNDVSNLISNQCKNIDGNVKSYIDEKLAGLNYQLVNSAHSEANPYVASKLVSCILGDVLGR